MLLILVKEITPRLNYIFKLMIHDLMGFEFRLTLNAEEFKSYDGAKFSYGDKPIDNELFFQSEKLLFEKGIEYQELSVFDWQGLKAFYSTNHKYLVPFDPFAAAFYLVSRYEEYLPHLRDAHDRFIETESIAYQRNFLQKPLVNYWAVKIKEIIFKHFPALKSIEPRYRYISTVDVDNAYAYLEKGFMRTTGAYLRSFSQFNFQEAVERTRVLFRMQRDPYDTYSLMHALHKKFNVHVIYFFLMGEYGENDKNIPVDSKKYHSLIKSLADYAETGIHPSYGSNKKPGRLAKELGILSRILKREVTKSRQHFLKLRLPGTYRQLIDVDIKDDYTMGYAALTGFRASICSTFNFYDLDLEQTTSLRIHPFACMDATFKYYMKTPPEEVMPHIKMLVDEVKKVNGTFISLWHNESLSENILWKGYRKVYQELIEYAHQ